MIIKTSLQLHRCAEANRYIRRSLRRINRRRHKSNNLVLSLIFSRQTHIFRRNEMIPAVLLQILHRGPSDLLVTHRNTIPTAHGSFTDPRPMIRRFTARRQRNARSFVPRHTSTSIPVSPVSPLGPVLTYSNVRSSAPRVDRADETPAESAGA